MKKCIKSSIFLLLTIFSMGSFSQPTIKVVENIEANFYIRTDTLKRVGNEVVFWQIIDYKQPKINKKGEQYLSMESQLNINCSTNTQTQIFIKVYSSSMLTGNLLASGILNQKNTIPSGTSLEVVRNFVCK